MVVAEKDCSTERLARLLHGFRRWLWRKRIVQRNASLDGFYRKDSDGASETTLETWFRDQFENPHELTVSIARAERWLAEAGFRFLRVFPEVFSSGMKPSLRVFSSDVSEVAFLRCLRNALVQLMWMLHPRESGYFIVVGARRDAR